MGQQLFKKRKKRKENKERKKLSRIVCTGKELFTSVIAYLACVRMWITFNGCGQSCIVTLIWNPCKGPNDLKAGNPDDKWTLWFL